ncbi:MAG: selenium cofactor biosynthesis protein YqeC [Muricoprocola sp.]
MIIQIFNSQGHLQSISAEDAFSFLKEKGHVVSLVGGGGKTSTMYDLAEHCRKKGWKVLVSTTTRICLPERKEILALNMKQVRDCWQRGEIAVYGEKTIAKDQTIKLKMPEEHSLHQLIQEADIVFLEADGANRKPCKVPRTHEPVILEESDIVLGIMGLDTLGSQMKEVCFCLEEVETLLKKSLTETMTEQDMAVILLSEKGTRKSVGDREYYMILNKSDLMTDRDPSGEHLRKLWNLLTDHKEKVYFTRRAS